MMEIQVLPLGTCSTSLSDFIAKAVKKVEESGMKHELSPMGTVVEGDVDALVALARAMHESAFEAGAMRVVTTIEIDDRRDRAVTMERKVASVMEKLG